MTAHTPGHWYVQDNSKNGGQLRVDSDTHGALADCGRGELVDDSRRATARLMATAPEMLEALKIAVVRLKEIQYQKASPKQIEFLEQVIARAEGK